MNNSKHVNKWIKQSYDRRLLSDGLYKVEILSSENIGNNQFKEDIDVETEIEDPFDPDSWNTDDEIILNNCEALPQETTKINEVIEVEDFTKYQNESKKIKLNEESNELIKANIITNEIVKRMERWKIVDETSLNEINNYLYIDPNVNYKKIHIEDILLKNLYDLNWYEPTLVQKILLLLCGQTNTSVVIASKTGSGKTGAFAIPIINKIINGRSIINKNLLNCIIIAPTRELVKQIYNVLKKISSGTGIKIVNIVGGINIDKQLRELKVIPNVIVATLGRFYDILLSSNDKSVRIKSEYEKYINQINFFVIDECDKYCQKKDGKNIEKLIKMLAKSNPFCQYYLSSATLINNNENKQLNTSMVLNIFKKYGINFKVVDVINNNRIDNSNNFINIPSTIQFFIYKLKHEKKLYLLFVLLYELYKTVLTKNTAKKIIVFCSSIAYANQVYKYIKILFSGENVYTNILNSRKKQKNRYEALEKFERNDKYAILVGTDIIARGIDVTSVTDIINLQVPSLPEALIHRSGRTARTEKIAGNVYIFYTAEEEDKYVTIFKENNQCFNAYSHYRTSITVNEQNSIQLIWNSIIDIENFKFKYNKAKLTTNEFDKLAIDAGITIEDNEYIDIKSNKLKLIEYNQLKDKYDKYELKVKSMFSKMTHKFK